ncbi:heterokaryon incompatibility protein-domain-containing protein [Whalleya microplaca]|nr:heterokaryon incompatibility protein-domain-containing protein [Whalleya microplaca]
MSPSWAEKPLCKSCRWMGDPRKLMQSVMSLIIFFSNPDRKNCIRCQIELLAYEKGLILKNGRPPIQELQEKFYPHRAFHRSFALFCPSEFCEVEALRPIPKAPRTCIDTSTQASSLWAKDQIESHQHCWESQVTGSYSVPTRLIDVNPDDLDGDVRLVENVPSGSRYAALSYCWGGHQPACQTTPSRLQGHKNRMAWSTFPKTFQDAVIFTRRLGLKYLWIDGVCIVQDDPEDWARESGRMFNVYKHSYVTLAALWGDNSDSGLFSAMSDFNPILLAELCFNDQRWPLYMRQLHGTYFSWNDDAAPLFSRAWAYQELLISTRVVFFTKQELAFECFCAASCECGLTQNEFLPNKILTGFFKKQKFFDKIVNKAEKQISQQPQGNEVVVRSRQDSIFSKEPGTLEKAIFPRVHLATEDVIWIWRTMVSGYQGMHLTNEEDKLPAIGAVAEQFQAIRPGEHYIAGLWSGSLEQDLLWCVNEPLEDSKRRLSTLPTWSWACSGTVFYYLPPRKDAIVWALEVIDYTFHSVDDNPFGAVSSCSLILRGRLLPVWFIWPNDTDAPDPLRIYRPGIEVNSFKVHMDLKEYYTSGQEPPQKVYLLYISTDENWSQYLILHREDKKHQIYSRLGILHPQHSPSGWRDHKILHEAFEKYSTTETFTFI